MAKQDTLSMTRLISRIKMPLLEFYDSFDDSIQHALSTKILRRITTAITRQAERHKLAVSIRKSS